MDNTCIIDNTKGHGMPFVTVQQQPQLLHSVQHLTPPPQHPPLIAQSQTSPSLFSQSLIRSTHNGIPLPSATSTAAGQMHYQQQQQQQPLQQTQPPPPQQQHRHHPSSFSSQSPSQHPSAYYYTPALPVYMQHQARKNSLRNDVFLFNGGADTISDTPPDRFRQASPALSPPLSPTEFLPNGAPETHALLFDYETRYSVEYPVPDSPSAEGDDDDIGGSNNNSSSRDGEKAIVLKKTKGMVKMEEKEAAAAKKDNTKEENQETVKTEKTTHVGANNKTSYKPTYISLTPRGTLPLTGFVAVGSVDTEKDPKSALLAFDRRSYSDVLPTPPESQRRGIPSESCTALSEPDTCLSEAPLSSETFSVMETAAVSIGGARKRKASAVNETSPLKNTTTIRKRRANSTLLADNVAGFVSTRRRSPKSSGTLSMIKAAMTLPGTTTASASAPATVRSSPSLSPSSLPSPSPSFSLPPTTTSNSNNNNNNNNNSNNSSTLNTTELRERAEPRTTQRPTIFEQLTESNIDWCRYCGTTEGVNWRPGPWGKRTLCNKHGCDYKGYGFACKLPRLNLTAYQHESIHERERPVLQHFCCVCHSEDSWRDDLLVCCEGCPKAYHQRCYPGGLSDTSIASPTDVWYCTPECIENRQKRCIVVELPRKRLPLMRSPKDDDMSDADSVASGRRGSTASFTEETSMSRVRVSPPLVSAAGGQTTIVATRRAARRRPRPFYGEEESEGLLRSPHLLGTMRGGILGSEDRHGDTPSLSNSGRSSLSRSSTTLSTNGDTITTGGGAHQNDFGSLLEEQFRFARRARRISYGMTSSEDGSGIDDNDDIHSDNDDLRDGEESRKRRRRRRRRIDPEDEEMDVAATLIVSGYDDEEDEEEEDDYEEERMMEEDDEEDEEDEDEERTEYVEDSYWA